MLALLIPIAGELFKNAGTALCEEQIQSSMETLAREIEIGTVLPGNNTVFDVDFSFFSCGGNIITNFTLYSPSSGADECVSNCQTANCMFVKGNGYTATGEATTIGEPVCVRLPLDVDFVSGGCGTYGYTDLPTSSSSSETVFKQRKYTLVLVKELSGGLNKIHICNYTG